MSVAKYPLQNDLMIRAAKGEKVEKTPVMLYALYWKIFKDHQYYLV